MTTPRISTIDWWIPAALVSLLALVATAAWTFRHVTGAGYFDWYLRKGSLIALATTLVTVGWGDVNRAPGLISAHPRRYVSAVLHTGGLAFMAFAGVMGRRREPLPPSATGALLAFAELIAATIAILSLAVLVFIWLLFVMPIQYFLFLFCGAPVRLALEAGTRPIAWRTFGGLESRQVGRDHELASGEWEIGMDQRPVTTTSLITAGVLTVLDLWRPWFLAGLLAW